MQRRWLQIQLRDMFLATLWIGIACGTGAAMWRGQATAPIWGYVTIFALLAAYWSLRGRYLGVIVTVAFAAWFFLILFWLHRPAILG